MAKRKTIVEKVVDLIKDNKQMTLNEIYTELPEHPQASIRGNINRHINTAENPQIQRVDKGIYSIVEIISTTKDENGKYHINYNAQYFCGDKEITFFHKDFVTDSPVTEGIFERKDNFDSFEELTEHEKSIRGILVKGDAVEILKKLKDESFNLIVTDPPYKVISGGNKSKKSPKGMLSKNDGKIFDFNNIEFSDYMPDLYRVLKSESHAYFFTNFLNLQTLMEEVQKVGFKIHNLLVWMKNNTLPNRWYMKNCEYVLMCRKGKAVAINNKSCQTVHQFNNIFGKKLHETEKPLEILNMYITNSSKVNDYALDPFGGSGSTMASALLNDRRCMTIEIDGKYIPTIKQRVSGILKTGSDYREGLALA